MPSPIYISWIFWAVWYAYWAFSARNRVRDTEESPAKREPVAGRLAYMSMMVIGLVLLFRRVPLSYLQFRLLPSTVTYAVLGLTIQAAGFAFAIWARRTLGKNWSGRITTGTSQELVIRGPYQIVRHPIYSGLLFGILGMAIVVGEVRAFLGLLILLVAIMIKLRREEAALREHFGSAYEEYSLKVRGLIPGL